MSDILIRGMEMPKEIGVLIVGVDSAGKVYSTDSDVELFETGTEAKAVPVHNLAPGCDVDVVLVPKIKKGKTLYWLWGDKVMPVQFCGVTGGCVVDGSYHVTCAMRTKKAHTIVHKIRGKSREVTYPAGETRYFYTDKIGVDVFFTREEAEAAIRKKVDVKEE